MWPRFASFVALFFSLVSVRFTLATAFVVSPTTSNLLSLRAGGSSSSSTTAIMAEVKVGDKIPSVKLMELTDPSGKPSIVKLDELIAGKKVAIFGVPGAFTPGCSKSHLPSFMEAQGDLKGKGVDLTICVATNDAYVMEGT